MPSRTAGVAPGELDYVEAHNEEGKPFIWTKTADEILQKMQRFSLRVQKVLRQ